MRDVDQLTASLADLDQSGWKLGEYIFNRPEFSDSVRLSLVTAGRVQALPRPIPSDAFRARSRSHLVTFIQTNALRPPESSPLLRARRAIESLLRPVLAPAAVALLVLGGSVGVSTASAGALPGAPLYGSKIAIERLQLLTALTPGQQLSVHLSIAAARLQEADAETGVGNHAESEALLHDYDVEIAKAESILLSQTTSAGSDSLLAQSEWRLLMLQQEHQRLVASTVAPVSPDQPLALGSSAIPGNGVGIVAVAQPTVSPEDPSKLQRTQADIQSSSNSVAVASDANSSVPAIVSVSGGGGVAVAVQQSDRVSVSAGAFDVSITDKLDRLVRVLVAEASAGDEGDAATTAQVLANEITSGLTNRTLSIDHLMYDRSFLEAELAVAPTSTQGPIRIALNAIYNAVPGSQPVVVTDTSGGAKTTATTPTRSIGSSPTPPSVGSPPTSPSVGSAPVSVAPKTSNPAQTSPGANSPVQAPPKTDPVQSPPTGQQQSGGVGQHPVPIVTAPPPPTPFIQKPIIVRDPSNLPSPSLTGRKPLTITKSKPVHQG